MTANEIKALRSSLGLTLAQFANQLHVAEATVSRWESGQRSPRDQAVRERLELLAHGTETQIAGSGVIGEWDRT